MWFDSIVCDKKDYFQNNFNCTSDWIVKKHEITQNQTPFIVKHEWITFTLHCTSLSTLEVILMSNRTSISYDSIYVFAYIMWTKGVKLSFS